MTGGAGADLEQLLLEQIGSWPGDASAAAVVDGSGVVALQGSDRVFGWASVTKLMVTLVTLDAVSQGRLSLEDPAGPPGSTVRHLLAHASGLAADSDRVLSPPQRRRIYSNRGFEVLGELLEQQSGTSFATLLRKVVLDPLSMHSTAFEGSPAHGARGPVTDLARLAAELLRPQHFPEAWVEQARTTVFPELSGVLPGFGRQEPNDWGLGFEVRGRKSPHWMSPLNSPLSFGHFGQAGAFLWVDPEAGLACVAAGDAAFGPWAAVAWPELSTRVLQRCARPGGRTAARKEPA